MHLIKRWILTLALGFATLANTALADDGGTKRAILILDASGSMWGQIDGVAKIDIARKAVAAIIGEIDADLHLGLMAYGHRKRGDCSDIELLIPPGPLDKEAMIRQVDSITPRGRTPLAASLVQAAETLRHGESKATVILISDGIETCGMDPCEAVAELKKNGLDLTAHVIGFDLADDEQAAIRCIADVTGGEFVAATDAASLGGALSAVMTKTLDPEAALPEPQPAPEPAPEPVVVDEPDTEIEESKVTFRTLLSDGGEEVKGYYTILRLPDNERVAAGSGTTHNLAPGKYSVRMKARDTQIERTVEIPAEAEFEVLLVLNAGYLKLKTFAEEGGEELKVYYTISRAGADLQGKRPRVASGSSGDFLLPAGEYHASAKWGSVTVEDFFEVTPNELSEGRLVAGAGVLNLTATLGEGGENVKVYFTIYSGKQKLDGSRERISAGASGPFKLPADIYHVEAKWGSVVANLDVEVKAGEATSATVVVPGGLLRSTVKDAAGEVVKRPYMNIYDAKESLTGRRTRITSGADGEYRIPEGEYIIETKLGDELLSAKATVKTGEATEVTLQSAAEE